MKNNFRGFTVSLNSNIDFEEEGGEKEEGWGKKRGEEEHSSDTEELLGKWF